MRRSAAGDWWLAFVLAEEAYRHFCEEALGEFVSHRPSLRRTYDPRRDKPAPRPGSLSG